MKDIILCGHTGCINRGCDAIVRSTSKMLNDRKIRVTLASHDAKTDSKFTLKNIEKIIQYSGIDEIKKNRKIKYLYDEIQAKLLGNKYYLYKDAQSSIISNIKDKVILNVGGDTYCYKDKPYLSYSLNKYAYKNNITNILWGCSIEKSNIDHEMEQDLKRYKMIFPRETYTYNNLIELGIDKEKLFLMCDPAFTLQKEETEISKEFKDNKIIGINISPLILKNGNKEIILKNVYNTIEYLIKNTYYYIALIPHVYEENTQDQKVNEMLYNKYKNTNRVIKLTKNYTSGQLKYIISKCSFFITARTHASIAAYSSNIPTLVLGYSIKSKGIANDLFGTYKGYVLPVQEIKNEREIKDAIIEIMNNEERIKKQLKNVLPEYTKKAYDATDFIIKKYCKY